VIKGNERGSWHVGRKKIPETMIPKKKEPLRKKQNIEIGGASIASGKGDVGKGRAPL